MNELLYNPALGIIFYSLIIILKSSIESFLLLKFFSLPFRKSIFTTLLISSTILILPLSLGSAFPNFLFILHPLVPATLFVHSFDFLPGTSFLIIIPTTLVILNNILFITICSYFIPTLKPLKKRRLILLFTATGIITVCYTILKSALFSYFLLTYA